MVFLDKLDHGTFVFFQHHRLAHQDYPWLERLLGYATELGSNVAFVVIGALLLGLSLWSRRPRTAVLLLVIFVGSALGTEAAKRVVAAPRPADAVDDEGRQIRSGSFPSGHAAKASVALPAFALLLGTLFQLQRSRFVLYAIAGVLVLLVGFSRIYLGMHYVTDVIGGWSFGLAWVMLWWTAELSRSRVEIVPSASFSTGIRPARPSE